VRTIPHVIAGRLDDRAPEGWGDVYDPATAERQATVCFADAGVVDDAVAAARDAFAGWRDVSLAARSKVLFALRRILDERRDDFARVITSEHGKVLDDARGEVQRGLEVVEFACGLQHLLKGERAENVSTAVDAWSIRQPLGVCAGISPFNFPLMVPLWMAPVAIACGNSFVMKPSEKDPTASNMLAEAWADAGLPPGVFQVVHGGGVAAEALVAHPDVAAVSSVGSTPIARRIYETATLYGKRVQALGGAKNHAVVLPDADIATAADAITGAAFGSAGERCMAISVVVAVGDVADRLVPAIAERAAALEVAPGTQPGADMGPLVTEEHYNRVRRYVDVGVAEGASLVVDGRACDAGPGWFLGPCLFDDVKADMTIHREEIFGPVLGVVRVDSFEEGLDLVNSNRFANGTAIFTADGGAARRYQNEVEVGMVGVNVPIPVPMAYFSFGGWKDSLFGDLHMHGAEGIAFFTRTKAVTSRWPRSQGIAASRHDGTGYGVDTVMPTST